MSIPTFYSVSCVWRRYCKRPFSLSVCSSHA